jgi:hypothetical protein
MADKKTFDATQPNDANATAFAAYLAFPVYKPPAFLSLG